MIQPQTGSTPTANGGFNVVTGAFGFSGRYITARLLSLGEGVRTLTGHPGRPAPFSRQIGVASLDFRDPDGLARAMQGATVLYNTYWVRFARGPVTHQTAVANTKLLIEAARQAGVRRIVHISITNPSLDSPLPYFRGKAELEQAIRTSGLSYAILRPALLFGGEDVLLNNIAWLLRRLPVFAVPGDGRYRVQPIWVDDLAALAVDSGHREDNFVCDAVGPETYTYDELVRLVRQAVGSHTRIVHVPPGVVALASSLLGRVVHDVVLTKDELRGLMADLLVSSRPPTACTSLRAWTQAHADQLGRRYASELQRHFAVRAGPG